MRENTSTYEHICTQQESTLSVPFKLEYPNIQVWDRNGVLRITSITRLDSHTIQFVPPLEKGSKIYIEDIKVEEETSKLKQLKKKLKWTDKLLLILKDPELTKKKIKELEQNQMEIEEEILLEI